MKAQIEPGTDRKIGLPQCVAAPVSLPCNAQLSTSVFGNPSLLSGLKKPPAGQLHRHADFRSTGFALQYGNGSVPASRSSDSPSVVALGKAT